MQKRIVLKLGTQVVYDQSQGLVVDRLLGIVDEVCQYHSSGYQFLLVSSGAIGLGQKFVAPSKNKNDLAYRQACAAVGQNLLINTYADLFKKHRKQVAQILLTSEDLSRRKSYLNLSKTLDELLRNNIVPIINENDTTSTQEIKEMGEGFGDNDKLSALIASKLGAQALFLFTNVDGIYNENPAENENARPLPMIESLDELSLINTRGRSSLGRGGMASKIEAARLASMSGVTTVIANGLNDQPLKQCFQRLDSQSDKATGTLIAPSGQLSKKKQWLGFSSGTQGALTINEGACQAIEDKKASLLAIGATHVEGKFKAGDVVSLLSPSGREIARGISILSSDDCAKVLGQPSKYISEQLPHAKDDVLIRRDDLIVFSEVHPLQKGKES